MIGIPKVSPRKWTVIYVVCLLVGVLAGYVATLIYKPSLLPSALRIGGVYAPTTVLFLGTDVVYEGKGRRKTVRSASFKGRSDTIMVARLDPYKNSVAILSIPRDTRVQIPGHGRQKVNAANALGGPELVMETLSDLLSIDIDHYVVLNLRGLEALVDELGGITVDVPKRMKYRDKSANLNIDLEPGRQTLKGSDAIGFVRFRHDQLGDIGRVQRQEIFMKAVLEKAIKPESWPRIPGLLSLAGEYSLSDLSTAELASYVAFVKRVPRENHILMMLPGNFSDSGDWLVNNREKRRLISRFLGTSFISADRSKLSLSLLNMTSDRGLARRLARELKEKGYTRIRVKQGESHEPLATSRIIAQKGNTADADLVRSDLGDLGTVVNASVGDIESEVTVELGEDMLGRERGSPEKRGVDE